MTTSPIQSPFAALLAPYLDPRQVHDLPAGLTKWQAIDWLGQKACRVAKVADPEVVVEAVRERERILSTGIGFEVAIPHVRHAGVLREALVVGRPPAPLDFDSIDGRPVRAVFFVLMPAGMHRRSIEVLGALAGVLKPEWTREAVFAATTPEEFVSHLLHATPRSTAIPA
jgi:mannitol/fructose-specific phosphotransferase system IIA component (Ntr-type)